nr:hypothetical protein [Tanacetum cinerariifolium]
MTAVKKDGLNVGSAKYSLGTKSVLCVHGKMIGVDESPVDFSGTFSINDDSNSNEETGIPPSFASLIDDESFVRGRFQIGLVFLFPCRQYWKLMLVLQILFIGYFIGKKLALHKSSSRLTHDQSSNPTSSTNTTPKVRNRRSSKQRVENSNLEEHLPLVVTMADNRTMAELLHAPTEGYAEAIVVSPIVAEQFELKWKFVGKKYSRCVNDYRKKSKVCNSRSKPISSQVKACDVNSNSGIAKLTHAVNQQTSVVTTAMMSMLKQFQATQPPASVKVVEETCVTCGGGHPYYQCLATGGNTFPELRDNIQGYISAAAVNYNQGNPGYRPHGIANQIRPPGFSQPNVQNNQNRFGPPQGFNRGNFNHEQSYQDTAQQNQDFHLNELEKIKRMNEANIKAMQTQIDMVKNELRTEMKSSIQTSLSNQTNEIKNMMASLLQMNSASTSMSGSLPINTVANLKGELKAITTRSGLVTDGPTISTPPKSSTPKVGERVEDTFMDPDLAEYTIKVPPLPTQKYKPPAQREFIKLHINITLADALVLTSKYQKMLKALLSNKEKLQELANTPLNENFSAVILKKLPEKLEDPGKFLIPCGFSELKCKALADLGASINLMPLSVWKKLGLPELIPTHMTLELAHRVICTPARIARDVFVPVGKFTFPADFVIVDYESDPRVPLILGRPFLWIARALIDVHGEEMILCDGDERLTLNMRHDTSSYSNQPQKESINLINVFNNSSEDFLEVLFSNQPSGNPTFSPHQELTSPEVNNDIFDSEGCNVLSEKLPDLDSTKDLLPPLHDNPLSDSTTYFSNSLLEEFADELPSNLKDSIDQKGLANLDDIFVDSIPEMFTDEHTLDYSSLPIFDVYVDDCLEVESDAENVYDDRFDSKGGKIKEFKLLIDELDLPCDFLPPSEYDSFLSQDFSRVDALPSTNNEDKTLAKGFCTQVFLSSASIGNHVSKSNRINVYLMAYFINDLRLT